MTTFRVDTSGRWSGGGQVVIDNLLGLTSAAGPIRPAGTVPIVPRNIPTSPRVLAGRFVWMPQNALPWGPPAPAEASLQRKLRLASRAVAMRATALIRISGAIPALPDRPTSAILHNVLDSAFDQLAARLAPEPHGGFLVAGSAHSYRALPALVEGYRRYRASGGHTGLWVQTSPGAASEESLLRAAEQDTDGLRVVIGGADRPRVLSLMAGSVGVLFPSTVEASPVTVLEAQALGRPIAVSDIRAHREITTNSSYEAFDVRDRDSVAAALHRLDEHGGTAPHPLQDATYRAARRAAWGDDVSAFLRTL
jgi:glycosyltransferase involved in cell wall biosynthesis